jgi:hypothetical protein
MGNSTKWRASTSVHGFGKLFEQNAMTKFLTTAEAKPDPAM